MTAQMELIAALEKATGPDRVLDGLILKATNPNVIQVYPGLPDYATEMVQREGLQAPTARTIDIPAYTASIDAAMTLAVRGWIISIERGFDDDGEYWSKVIVVDSHSIGRGCDPSERVEFVSYGPGEPPRYIAAAWLKARATLTKDGQ